MVMFWLEIKIRVMIMYFYLDNERVDYEILVILGIFGEIKYM